MNRSTDVPQSRIDEARKAGRMLALVLIFGATISVGVLAVAIHIAGVCP